MDLSRAMSLADPQLLADQIQYKVDSVAGRHVDLASIQVLADAIHEIDTISIIVNLIVIIFIIFIVRAVAEIVDQMLRTHIPRVINRAEMKMDKTMQLMIRRIASATIYLAGLMLVILQIPQLHKVATAMLAGAGILGLAVGYAAKDSLSNFTSGIFIAIFQPFRVGDLVDFRGDYGQVEDLTLRHTVIRTADNRRIIVPNSIISTEPVINWTIREKEITWSVDFDLAREIILEKARGHSQVLKDRPLSVQLVSSKNAELILRLEVTVPGRNVAKAVGNEIREAVIKELEAQGIPPAPLL
ncbi:mechanosensitive ion channel family protein [Methanothrix sp.]|uniref:mechanosensitive ion channel family protein n=1 Tax=Methanothrix sp. TaxID=90426 RepID=UPI003BB78981